VAGAAVVAAVEEDVAAEQPGITVNKLGPPDWLQRLPRLGVGLGFRRPLARPIVEHAAEIDFLEIISEHYLGFSRFDKRELRELRRRFPLVAHGLSLSPGTLDPPDHTYLGDVGELVKTASTPWWSDHLAMTRAGRIDIGHLAPVPLTGEMLGIVCRNINQAKDRIKCPFAVENIAHTLQVPGAEMGEAEFLSQVLEQTDSGLLLDLMNLHANARNHCYDAYEFLESIPLDRVVQIHIIGGHYARGVLVDSHSRPTPEEVWQMLEFVARRVDIKAVLLEWDEQFPEFSVIIDQLSRARAILAGARLRTEVSFAVA
ncbi:MAG TPA: DUF692 domain-containing protein, partial [Blastocatellia bacterium]|nr:DUF692 domain-containing protein [Blastocatellia bacterium]